MPFQFRPEIAEVAVCCKILEHILVLYAFEFPASVYSCFGLW